MKKERFKFISTVTSPSMTYKWDIQGVDTISGHMNDRRDTNGKENKKVEEREYRLSVFMLSCLSSGQKCVHAMNSVVEYMRDFHDSKETEAWIRNGHKFIMREIDNEEILSLVIKTLEKNDIAYVKYREKDLDCLLTSVAAMVDKTSYDKIMTELLNSIDKIQQ